MAEVTLNKELGIAAIHGRIGCLTFRYRNGKQYVKAAYNDVTAKEILDTLCVKNYG